MVGLQNVFAPRRRVVIYVSVYSGLLIDYLPFECYCQKYFFF